MTPEEYAACLLHGELPVDVLDDPTRQEVAARLARCGLALRRRAGVWTAVAVDAAPPPGAHPVWRIGADEAVLLLAFAALLERQQTTSVPRERLIDAVSPRLYRRYRVEHIALPRLVNRQLLVESGDAYRPGPRFSAVDSQAVRDLVAGTDILGD
jgi:hypothetical protein